MPVLCVPSHTYVHMLCCSFFLAPNTHTCAQERTQWFLILLGVEVMVQVIRV